VVDEPDRLRRTLLRPASILWDGIATWVLLEGHGADVDAEIKSLGPDFAPVGEPPALPDGGRWSVAPSALHEVVTGLDRGTFVAEIGVGIVHTSTPAPPQAHPVSPTTAVLHRRIKANFDPAGRLNPGRVVA
jgi:hypothetical protein